MDLNTINKLQAFCVIVNRGYASKVLKFAKKHGIMGGTVFLGVGTSKHNRFLNLLDLTDVHKEILLMLVDCETVEKSFMPIVEKFKFHKPNHGIAFTMPVNQIIGSHFYSETYCEKEVKSTMFKAIFTIVDKGKGEDVMTAATHAGSRGGTIINARGSGVHETSRVFNMDIAPEKEVVLILAKSEDADKIAETIVKELDIKKPGNGVVFIQDIDQTYGLH